MRITLFLLTLIRIFLKKAFKTLCQSTHLGRRLVLEWAQTENGLIEEIRKRTAKHFYQGNIFLYLLCLDMNWFTLIDIIESCIILKVFFKFHFREFNEKI